MMASVKEELKNQSGEVMLEAVIVLVPTLILLMVMLSLSFLFYQQAMMTSVATEIASDIAKNYKYTALNIGEDNLTLNDINTTGMFRMNFGKNSLKRAHMERSETYAEWRVALTSLGLHPEDADVECTITNSGIGRAYVKVTVSQKTDFFLSGILDMTEVADEHSIFSATAYAECVDLMGYTSMVNFTEYASGKLSIFNGIGGFYMSVKNLAQKLLN